MKPSPYTTSAGSGVCRTCGGKKYVPMQKSDGKLTKSPCPSCQGKGSGYATK